MKTTSKYNKSQIMKRAWNIYKGNNPYSYSFSAALRRAWEVEKATIEYNERKAKRAAIEAENAAAKAKRGLAMRGQSDASTTTRTPVSISISETDGKTIH